MDIQPLENRVVIVPCKEKLKPGGIIIPDDAKEKSMEGIVIAVGPGLISYKGKFISMHLKVGDKVLYSKFVGTEVVYQNKEFLIMKESEVLAILGQDNSK